MREHRLVETKADSMIVSQLLKKGITFTSDNKVILLSSGYEKFKDMFTAIDQAKESIHMEYFNFRNDSIVELLIKHLEERVKHGVEVRLIYDAFGNSSNNRPLKKKDLENLRNKGIQIYAFDPIKFPWINHVFSRDHRKIVVIDGQIAYTGGMNIADYYITGTEKVGEWHDMHCRLEGSSVNYLQEIFLETWYDVTGEIITDKKYYKGGQVSDNLFNGLKEDKCESAGTKKVGIINRVPRRTSDIIRFFYENAINNAHDSIKIINPYFTLSRKLKKALKKAVKRGVNVEIMLSIKNDIPLTPDCGFYNAHKLMKNGCHIWLYKPGFHHTKIIMVDGLFCTVGSANLNARSLRWDYEENAVIIDQCTTQQLDSLFNSQKKDSIYLTPETWNELRTPWQKFRGWFAHLLSPFL
jgi:cardiolipin synthase